MNKFLVLLLLVVSNTLSAQVIVDIPPPKPGTGIQLAKSKYEKNPKNPVLSYYRLSKKPLFGLAKKEEDNRVEVNRYVIAKLKEQNIELDISIGGRVILGKKGQVLYVDLFYCKNETLKPIIERIVKRMPRWKRSGYYKDKVIRVDYGLWIDIKKYKDYVLNM